MKFSIILLLLQIKGRWYVFSPNFYVITLSIHFILLKESLTLPTHQQWCAMSVFCTLMLWHAFCHLLLERAWCWNCVHDILFSQSPHIFEKTEDISCNLSSWKWFLCHIYIYYYVDFRRSRVSWRLIRPLADLREGAWEAATPPKPRLNPPSWNSGKGCYVGIAWVFL